MNYRKDYQVCEARYLKLKSDWEGREIYHQQKWDFTIKPQAVFIGASEIEHWNLSKFFPNSVVINRGIGEQVAGQMLLRFYQDVIALAPEWVVIVAGSNDIRNRVPEAFTQEYIQRMCEAAQRHHIQVLLTSITPVNDTQKGMLQLRPLAKIRGLNFWIRDYAQQHGHDFVDFYQGLAGANGLLPEQYSVDGVHLNEAGYARLSQLLRPILFKEKGQE